MYRFVGVHWWHAIHWTEFPLALSLFLLAPSWLRKRAWKNGSIIDFLQSVATRLPNWPRYTEPASLANYDKLCVNMNCQTKPLSQTTTVSTTMVHLLLGNTIEDRVEEDGVLNATPECKAEWPPHISWPSISSISSMRRIFCTFQISKKARSAKDLFEKCSCIAQESIHASGLLGNYQGALDRNPPKALGPLGFSVTIW